MRLLGADDWAAQPLVGLSGTGTGIQVTPVAVETNRQNCQPLRIIYVGSGKVVSFREWIGCPMDIVEVSFSFVVI